MQLDDLSGSKNQAIVAHAFEGKHKTLHKQKKDNDQAGESTSKP